MLRAELVKPVGLRVREREPRVRESELGIQLYGALEHLNRGEVRGGTPGAFRDGAPTEVVVVRFQACCGGGSECLLLVISRCFVHIGSDARWDTSKAGAIML